MSSSGKNITTTNTPSSSSRLPRATSFTTSTSTPTPTPRSSTPSSARGQQQQSSSTKHVYHSTSTTTSAPLASSSSSSKIHSRSKSSSVQPKILPFPDLSTIRYSRESSRANSPLSTPPIERLGVTFDQMIMMRTTSTDALSPPHSAALPTGSSRAASPNRISTSASASISVSTPALASSTSPPVSSPLAVPRPPPSTTPTTASRGRSSTVPNTANNITIGSPIFTPNRTQGFRPSSPTRTPLSRTAVTPNPSALTRPATNQASSIRSIDTGPTPAPTPLTTAVFPIPSTQTITDHIYQSFLKGICADIRLVIRKWGVCYHVHRMVLAQASFFHSLFLGGFSETTPAPRRTRKGKERSMKDIVTDDEWSGEDIELRFDDPNISRAAFEICLSRLYSPRPNLHYPTALLPTSSRLLTHAFSQSTSPDLQSLQSCLSSDGHLATPRLLLSLLATTIYIGHASFTREILASILRTISPLTVNRYLAFAVGDGIGDEEWEGQTVEGAKGLQGIAKQLREGCAGSVVPHADDDEEMVEEVLRAAAHTPRRSTDSDTKIRDDDSKVGETSDVFSSSQIPTLRFPSRSSSMRSADVDPFSFASADARLLPHFYGVVGNKIGEACACWLARWGADILHAEMETSTADTENRIWAHRGLPARFIHALLSSDYLFVPNEMERYRIARKVLNLRRQGWEEEMDGTGDISLVPSESTEHGWDEWEEEEAELQKIFAEGIHYSHMTFDDLSTIAADIDPSTSLPYAPLAVLQAAHWTAADLRSRVTAHERAASPALVDDENELGLTQTTSSIATTTNKRRRPTPRSRVPSPAASTFTPSSPGLAFDTSQSAYSSATTVYHPVPSDETHRIGASGLVAFSPSMMTEAQGVPDFGPELLGDTPDLSGKKPKAPPHGEKNFFGLQGGKTTSGEIEDRWVNEGGAFAMSRLGLGDSGPTKKEDRWSKIEPFRFSVEFWDVDKLGEKERFYSSTHFYAGSFFNCYVQMIKRKEKGVQLGIYLHRQSPNEPFPIPSAPRGDANMLSTSASVGGLTVPSTGVSATPILHHRSLSISPNTAAGFPGSPPAISGSLGAQTTLAGSGMMANDAPYQDTRAVTKAYFSISCASALGTALIRFTSGPDSFAHSQSWGWKSSALKSEEYIAVPIDEQDENGGAEAEDGREHDQTLEEGVMGWRGDLGGQSSLRATVVVGVV